MSHSLNKVWIHAVWKTKLGISFIETGVEKQIHSLMQEQFEAMGCKVAIINGMPDHVHCLFVLNIQKSISEVIHQVKGSSSFYINKEKIISGKFAWQTGYAVYSVSDSGIDAVYQYIMNQKIHHARKSIRKEWEKC